jgi:hypothetical protein
MAATTTIAAIAAVTNLPFFIGRMIMILFIPLFSSMSQRERTRVITPSQ